MRVAVCLMILLVLAPAVAAEPLIVLGSGLTSAEAIAALNLATDERVIEQASTDERAYSSDYRLDGFLVRGPADMLEGNEQLRDAIEVVTDDDTDLLADGVVRTRNGAYRYQQYWRPGTGKVDFAIADDIPDDPAEEPDMYLVLPRGEQAYTYELELLDPLELAHDDGSFDELEGRTLTMMGGELLVISAEHVGTDHLRLTLLGGSGAVSVREGETIVLEGHEVTPVLVSEDEEVLLDVDGQAERLAAGETQRFGEVEVGVREVMVNDQGGVVEVVLSGERIVLEDRNISSSAEENEIEVAGDAVDGSDVQISGYDGDETIITEISISWTPTDTYYVGPDERLSSLADDALFFGTWDLAFMGFRTKDSKAELYLEPRGDDEYELIFENRLGDELALPLFFDDAGSFTRFGTDDERLVVDEGTPITPDDYFIVTSDGHAGRWSARGYTHLLRYERIDVNDAQVRLEDVATGETIIATFDANETEVTIAGYDYTILINQTNESESAIWADLDNDGTIESGDSPVLVAKSLATIDLIAYDTFVVTTKELEEGVALSTWAAYGTTESVDSFRITVTDSSGEIDVADVERCIGANQEQILAAMIAYYTAINGSVLGPIMGTLAAQQVMDTCFATFSSSPYEAFYDVGTSERRQASDQFGTLVEWEDVDGPDTVSIASLEEQAEMLVVLAEREEELRERTTTMVVTSLDPTRVVMDHEYTSGEAIIIGGPCVNSATAELMGNEDCTYGFDENGVIKRLGEATVVAGATAEQTLAALEHYASGSGDAAVVRDGDAWGLAPLEWSRWEQPADGGQEQEGGEMGGEEDGFDKNTQCDLPSYTSQRYRTLSTKFGIGEEHYTDVSIATDGLKGSLTFEGDEEFRARFGIDWFEVTTDIHEESCSGPVVRTHTFKQKEGDKILVWRFELPKPGCYCVEFTNEDMVLDDANIHLIEPSIFLLHFSAKSNH